MKLFKRRMFSGNIKSYGDRDLIFESQPLAGKIAYPIQSLVSPSVKLILILLTLQIYCGYLVNINCFYKENIVKR